MDEFESDDSFFEDPKQSKKKPEKKSLEDLFGLKDDPPIKPKVRFDFDQPSEKSKSLDWLDEAEVKKPPKVESKSFDLLDELLPSRGRRNESDKIQPLEPVSTILEPRRGRRSSNTGITDVLGLFPTSEPAIIKAPDPPEWLGRSDTTISTQKTDSPPITIEKVVEEQPKPTISAISNLQTQESFLLVSMQLKRYEENLSDIKNQQQAILKNQQTQFDTFLNKYIDKQKLIEEDMLKQQERINDHIRGMSMTTSSTSIPPVVNDSKLLESLKQRQQEEFFLMEESYKKQISLVESASNQVEEQLKNEIKTITDVYEDKIKRLKNQHIEELNDLTEKLKINEEKFKQEVENLRQNSKQNVNQIKDDFLLEIERIKEQRLRETQLFTDSHQVSQQLTNTLNKLEKNEEILEGVQTKLLENYKVYNIAKEISIETKEKELETLRTILENSRAQTETDRSQLFGLIQTLERKIAEQNTNAQEDRWAVQQLAATLAARTAAFDRETEFSRAAIERERAQLKSLKEAILMEQEETVMKLTEEKLQLQAERARLDVGAKLMNNYEIEKIKVEAQTAIEVAKDLTEELNEERRQILRQKNELETTKNKLMEKERQLNEKEESLESMKLALQQRSYEDRRIIEDAKLLESRYKEKLLVLQNQASSLSKREKKLAEDKLNISKERLTLYSTARHKKCQLCQEEDNIKVDVDTFKLRMELMDDERNSEVSREDSFPRQ